MAIYFCGISDDQMDLTHTALQVEALPLRADGGPGGVLDGTVRVPICAQCAIDYAAQLPSLQADGPGDSDQPGGPA
jgi:hypothetical protein